MDEEAASGKKVKRNTSDRNSGRLPMTPLSVSKSLPSGMGNLCASRWLIESVVTRNSAGNRHQSLNPGLSATMAVNASRTGTNPAGSVDVNRNGEIAPVMSNAQAFNDPPLTIPPIQKTKTLSDSPNVIQNVASSVPPAAYRA